MAVKELFNTVGAAQVLEVLIGETAQPSYPILTLIPASHSICSGAAGFDPALLILRDQKRPDDNLVGENETEK